MTFRRFLCGLCLVFSLTIGTVVQAQTGLPEADLDEDCDVDLVDFRQMQNEFTGAIDGCCVDNRQCGSGEVCIHSPGDCGGFGECGQRPPDCPTIFDPVCGCDGRTYGNACEARMAGVSVQHEGPCELPICLLRPDPGPCRGIFVRWFYNSENDQCERFLYGGCEGNANNFETRAECETSCRPQRDCRQNGDCPDGDYCARPAGECDSIGVCVRRPDVCDPTDVPVCGCDGKTYPNAAVAAGAGVSVAHLGPCDERPCELPIDPGPCRAFIVRWGYNQVTNQCQRFIYGGCLGNANNFETHAECLDSCVPPRPCQDSTECPRDQYCQSPDGTCGDGVCAPRPEACPDIYDPVCGCDGNTYGNRCRAARAGVLVETLGPCEPDVCALPIERGPCDAYFERFAFNTETGRCEPFVYGGCGGNANNFATIEDCNNTCGEERPCQSNADCHDADYCKTFTGECGEEGVCTPRPLTCPDIYDPVCGCDGRTYGNKCRAAIVGVSVNHFGPCDDNACNLSIEPGPCEAAIPRYAFDQALGQCVRFIYGGCLGNSNNFPTLEACEQRCGDPKVCELPLDPGECTAAFPRWGFDPSVGKCVEFTWGGCGGNANNFETLEECGQVCPSEDPCLQPTVSGPCDGAFVRFTFNQTTGMCERFIYGGCGGNANNFATLQECEGTCAPVDRCELPIESGPCLTVVENIKYGFDQELGDCVPFHHACEGNANRFDTYLECIQACPPTEPCDLPIVVGPCRAVIPRYGFDAKLNACVPFNYGGCGGNDNNYLTLSECQRSCGQDVCRLQPDVGPCDAVVRRYFYNSLTGTCEEFIWGGCEGNANNFASLEECNQSSAR